MAEARRVALLARPGTACDNLQSALGQAGAEVVHVGDPTAGDVAALVQADPGAVLVALEPAVESALDAFDAILQDPARIVIYDEAELAAVREGWDAARWVRHLAAKLAGHADVLPPGREMDDGAPVEPAASAAEPAPVEEVSTGEAPAAWPDIGLVDFEMAGESPEEPVLELAAEPSLEPSHEPNPEAMPTVEHEAAPAETRSVTLQYKGSLLADEITLAPLGNDEPPQSAEASVFEAPVPESAMPLEARDTGAAVVLAGIGGPDAVRQFLGALPEHFPRPVLVHQRLDGGRHDRLVRQLQRATALPVELATTGGSLAAGHVYIVPDGMATEAGPGGQRFVDADGSTGPLAGLPAADSAVLLLSGADPSQVDAVMALAAAGAFVAGQSPEECFDNAAPGAAIALGADSGSPSQLAERVASRWNK